MVGAAQGETGIDRSDGKSVRPQADNADTAPATVSEQVDIGRPGWPATTAETREGDVDGRQPLASPETGPEQLFRLCGGRRSGSTAPCLCLFTSPSKESPGEEAPGSDQAR